LAPIVMHVSRKLTGEYGSAALVIANVRMKMPNSPGAMPIVPTAGRRRERG